jgi:predicted Fe-Mo cluster-binding NifX family protein
MRIAAVSEDGVTISQHFGRAPFYVVLTVEDGNVVAREKREKAGHVQFEGEAHRKDAPGSAPRRHGFDAAAQGRHVRMLEAVADCSVLVARGMGAGAYESIRRAGIRPLVADVTNIDEAVQAYLSGTLTDHVEKLH